MRKPLIFTLTYLFTQIAFALPIEVQQGEFGSGSINVQVSFDGTYLPMKFDTGARETQVLKSNWNSAYPVLRQVERGGASGIRYTCDVVRFDAVSVEDFQRSAFEADRCDLDRGEHLLALDYFANQILMLNFHIELNPNGAMGIFPLKVYGNGTSHIGIPIQIQREPYYAVFDTGAELSAVDQAFVDTHTSAFEFLQDVVGEDPGGNSVAMKLYRLKNLTINDVTMPNELVLSFEFGSVRNYFGKNTPLIVGFNIIAQHNWILDLRNQKWDMQ